MKSKHERAEEGRHFQICIELTEDWCLKSLLSHLAYFLDVGNSGVFTIEEFVTWTFSYLLISHYVRM